MWHAAVLGYQSRFSGKMLSEMPPWDRLWAVLNLIQNINDMLFHFPFGAASKFCGSVFVCVKIVMSKLLRCVLAAAKMMVYLEPSSEKMAFEIATALDESLSGRSIQVGHHSFTPSLLTQANINVCPRCRSAPRCWRLCGKATLAVIIRRLLRPTELPAIRSSPTASHSSPLVTKTTSLQSVPMVTCSQGSTVTWPMKCDMLEHRREPSSTDLPLPPVLGLRLL